MPGPSHSCAVVLQQWLPKGITPSFPRRPLDPDLGVSNLGTIQGAKHSSVDVSRVARFRDALLIEASGGHKSCGGSFGGGYPTGALIDLCANQ